jgi:hypothetical protein
MWAKNPLETKHYKYLQIGRLILLEGDRSVTSDFEVL